MKKGHAKISENNSSLIRGKKLWTREEDYRLKKLVEEHGHTQWILIAGFLPGRNAKQCRERFHNHVKEGISGGDWTKEDDLKLLALQQEHGNKWTKMSTMFNGRSGNSLKNRYHLLLRARLTVEALQTAIRKSLEKPPSSYADQFVLLDENRRFFQNDGAKIEDYSNYRLPEGLGCSRRPYNSSGYHSSSSSYGYHGYSYGAVTAGAPSAVPASQQLPSPTAQSGRHSEEDEGQDDEEEGQDDGEEGQDDGELGDEDDDNVEEDGKGKGSGLEDVEASLQFILPNLTPRKRKYTKKPKEVNNIYHSSSSGDVGYYQVQTPSLPPPSEQDIPACLDVKELARLPDEILFQPNRRKPRKIGPIPLRGTTRGRKPFAVGLGSGGNSDSKLCMDQLDEATTMAGGAGAGGAAIMAAVSAASTASFSLENGEEVEQMKGGYHSQGGHGHGLVINCTLPTQLPSQRMNSNGSLCSSVACSCRSGYTTTTSASSSSSSCASSSFASSSSSSAASPEDCGEDDFYYLTLSEAVSAVVGSCAVLDNQGGVIHHSSHSGNNNSKAEEDLNNEEQTDNASCSSCSYSSGHYHQHPVASSSLASSQQHTAATMTTFVPTGIIAEEEMLLEEEDLLMLTVAGEDDDHEALDLDGYCNDSNGMKFESLFEEEGLGGLGGLLEEGGEGGEGGSRIAEEEKEDDDDVDEVDQEILDMLAADSTMTGTL